MVLLFMNKRRFRFGIVIAPLIVPLGIFIFGGAIQQSSWGILAIMISAFFSYFGMFFIGLPLIYLLRRIGWLNIPMLVLSGALGGCVIIYAYSIFMAAFLTAGSSIPFDFIVASGSLKWSLIFFGASLSAVIAVVFGIIAGIPFKLIRA